MDPNNTSPQPAAETPAATSDTITLTTPNGSVVVLKGYISGGAMEDMKRAFVENIEFRLDAEGNPVENDQVIKGSTLLDVDAKAMELFVISVNGSSDNAYQKVRDLPLADYDFVKAKLEEITGPLALKK